MSDPRYAHVGPVEVRLMEECAEVIQVLSKAQRFGWDDIKPEQDKTNKVRLWEEMVDVINRYNELADQLNLPRFEMRGVER